jgi:type IX secretion system PorP/SprF family membrane protein
MSMKKILLTCFLGIGAIVAVQAQDPQFSQYYQAPLYLNPGFTGITPQQRLVVNNRIQWPNLPQAYTTYAVSYDIWVDELKSGLGLLVTTDKMGTAAWRTTTAQLLYSYKVKLTDKIVFSPGLSFGYGVNGIDRSKLVFGDEIQYAVSPNQTINPQFQKLGNQQYFDFGSGFIVYSKDVWLGASFSHINTPNLSILNETNRLAMKTTIHGGLRIPLYNGPRTLDRVSYLTPSFIYLMQGTSTQLSLGINYHIDPLSIGVLYRGKPYQHNDFGTINQDALIFNMGLYLASFTIGYSYDFSISKLSTSSGGAHEISIVYEFVAKPLHRGVKKRNRLIPCPTFNRKPSFWEN